MRPCLRVLVAVFAVAFAACGPQDAAWSGEDEAQGSSELALTFTAADTGLVLAFVNHPGTDLSVLDGKVGLDRRAAANIVTRRNGPDGRAPTEDDVLFRSLAELDALPYVGDAAFTRLLQYARANPPPQAETVKGVYFQGWEAATVVWGVNTEPAATLDGLLDARAARGLVAARPFTSVTPMGAVAYVGPTALERLRLQARTWWAARQGAASLAGTFKGVAFDEALAVQALAIANGATREQLVAHGVASAPATALVAARPYATLAAVAAVSGVGTATLQALATWARAGTFGSASLDVAQLRTQLEALTADLYFPSETDARMLFVSAPGLGTAAITEAVIREKLSAQHDALLPQVMWVDASDVALAGRPLLERRSAVDMLNRLITNADPNDEVSLANAARFATLRDFLQANLTDLVVFRFGRVNISTFIVGRTADGQLVGLLTGQVET